MQPAERRDQQGFTLIEIMISMTVLLIGIVGILALQMSLMRESSFSRHTVEASVVGEQMMEILMTMPTAAIESMVPTDDDRLDGQADVGFSAMAYQEVDSLGEDATGAPFFFGRELFITRLSTSPPLYNIEVRVQWEERGDPYSISMVTQRN